MNRIGIAVTTRDRPGSLARTLAALRLLIPPEARLVVVDDASSQPAAGATYRFERNVGIAAAKNKCLELLDDCEHIFLFDDDTRPKAAGWWLPYVGSPLPHLMYVFVDYACGPRVNDTVEVYRDAAHVAYSHPRGCMLYLHRSCLERVGGMDWAYGAWGYEHADLSDRICEAGLTPHAYTDVAGSHLLIHSEDEYRETSSSVPGHVRSVCIPPNKARYNASRGVPTYIDYRERESA